MAAFNKSNPKGLNGLTPLQQRFAEEYVKDYNATEAYLRANDKPVQRNSAMVTGCNYLKKPEVLAYIREIQKRLFDAKCVTYERLADELSKIAFDPEAPRKDRMQAIALLQKQMGLDQIKVNADINQVIDIKVGIEDDKDKSDDK